jgi:hypothetical protein
LSIGLLLPHESIESLRRQVSVIRGGISSWEWNG